MHREVGPVEDERLPAQPDCLDCDSLHGAEKATSNAPAVKAETPRPPTGGGRKTYSQPRAAHRNATASDRRQCPLENLEQRRGARFASVVAPESTRAETDHR